MISSFDSRTANRFKKKESNKKLLMPSIPFPQISKYTGITSFNRSVRGKTYHKNALHLFKYLSSLISVIITQKVTAI